MNTRENSDHPFIQPFSDRTVLLHKTLALWLPTALTKLITRYENTYLLHWSTKLNNHKCISSRKIILETTVIFNQQAKIWALLRRTKCSSELLISKSNWKITSLLRRNYLGKGDKKRKNMDIQNERIRSFLFFSTVP